MGEAGEGFCGLGHTVFEKVNQKEKAEHLMAPKKWVDFRNTEKQWNRISLLEN